MRSIRNGVLGAVLMVSLFVAAAPTQAASLTSAQVNSIINLLNTFGADPSTVLSVQSVLTGRGSGSYSTSTVWIPGQGGWQQQNGQGGTPATAGIEGAITARVSTSTITVQPTSGTTTVVAVTASTSIQVFATSTASTTQPVQPTVGTIANLIVGAHVVVDGIQNTDSSITAVHIRVGAVPPAQTQGTTTPGQNPGQSNQQNQMGQRGDDYHNGVASSTRDTSGDWFCLPLSRDLSVGAHGDDVAQLQTLLAQDSTSGFTGISTGYFGKATANALAHFQQGHGIASSTTGFLGALTRTFFGRQCGTSTATSSPQH